MTLYIPIDKGCKDLKCHTDKDCRSLDGVFTYQLDIDDPEKIDKPLCNYCSGGYTPTTNGGRKSDLERIIENGDISAD